MSLAEQSFKTPNNLQVKEWIMQIQKHAKVVVKKRSKSIIKISINLLAFTDTNSVICKIIVGERIATPVCALARNDGVG